MRFLLAILLSWSLSLPALGAVQATVSSTTVSHGDTVRLELQRDGQSDSQPDLGPLKKDFDILGSGSGANLEIINGHISSTMQMTVLLSPKHDGKIEIPPLQWGSERSAAIEINVGKSSSPEETKPQSADHVFLSTSLEPQKPYVQAAAVLTVRLYADQPLYQATLDFPVASDVIVKPFGQDKASNETRNGRSYQVIERKYLLFAQKSGKISLEGPVLDAEIADVDGNDPFNNMFGSLGAMMNPTRHLHLRTNPIQLDVLPRPENLNPWLPAQGVTLDETWGNKAAIHAGEPLERHIHLAALGLTGEQLPDPATLLNLPDGIKAYPDQASISDTTKGNTVLGGRDQNIALIAKSAGRYVLPALKLSWWDTLHNRRLEATLPEETLNILPALQSHANPAVHEAMPAATIKPGKKISVFHWQVLGLLFSAILAWWYFGRRKEKVEHDERPIHQGKAYKAFQEACLANDPHQARRHLLDWASAIWPENPPAGLNALSRRMDDEKLASALRELDRACYANQAWLGLDLVHLPKGGPLRKQEGKTSALPELYS